MLNQLEDIAVTADSPLPATPASHQKPVTQRVPAGEKPQITGDVLIEEVSIDGMCGVY